MIDVGKCVDELERRWTTTLGNVSSDALRQTWGVLFGAFNWHAEFWNDITPKSPNSEKFTVLNFATGTAKTQSLVVLGDHLSRHPKPEHPGVLVVQRFIKDAKLLVEQINNYTPDSKATAITYNSETPDLSLGTLNNYPFLVITHAAYQNACAGRDLRDEDHPFDPTNWEHFMDYEGRTRRLVIIDEAMQLWRDAEVSPMVLKAIDGCVTAHWLRKKYRRELKVLRNIADAADDFNYESNGKGETVSEAIFFRQGIERLLAGGAVPTFDRLQRSLKACHLSEDDLRLYRNTLKKLHVILKDWFYWGKGGRRGAIMSHSQLLLPWDFRGAVVLDATAKTDIIYKLLGAPPSEVPAGARTYANATLHISRGHDLGRNTLLKKPTTNAKRLVKYYSQHLKGQDPAPKHVLFIVHKRLAPYVREQLRRQHFPWRCAVAYWGNLDGRNDWDKYDTCIVFGLPYMPPQVSANAIMAIQRPSDDSFLRDKKLRQSVRNSQMAVPIIQGMNRIRSRKTIDSAGNCAPCHWYLPLSSEDNLSDAVERHIEVAMPELNVDREWNFLQLPKTGALGKLLVCLEDLGPGEHTRAEVLEASGKSTRQFTTMIQEFKAGHVPGVSYERRRGGCVFVVKAQLQAA